MDQNDNEIKLLKTDPGKLLEIYQEIIEIIVRKYRKLGFISERESDDLIQEIPERVVTGGDEVRGDAGGIDELHFGRIVCIGKLIDLQILPDCLDTGFGRALD